MQNDLHENTEELQKRVFQILLQAADLQDEFFLDYSLVEQQADTEPETSEARDHAETHSSDNDQVEQHETKIKIPSNGWKAGTSYLS